MSETAPPKRPIFFGITRSFWFGWFPALLTILDFVFAMFTSDETSGPVAGLVAGILGLFGVDVDPLRVEQIMRGLAPFYALVVAQQRAGAARPYTMTANAATLK